MTEQIEAAAAAAPTNGSYGRILGREDILKAQDRTFKEIVTPEWGGTVRIASLTAKEKDAYEKQSRKKNKKGEYEVDMDNYRARLVALCVVDEKGNRVFSDFEALLIGEKNAAAVGRLFDECQKLNGYTEEKAEDTVKNSEPAPEDSSLSA